jgi:hypothetical protein
MPITKLKNGQLPDTISSKTVDNSNDINTTTTRLKITGGSNGQVLSTDGSGNLNWATVGGTGSPTAVVTKTADETVINSTTLQDDDELFYNFLAGKNYYIRLQLLVSRSSNVSQPTLSLAFAGNSNGYFLRVNQTTPVFGTYANGSSSATTGTIVGNVSQPHPVEVIASLRPVTDFTGYFRWAQTTLNATSGTVIMKGSQMLIWEFA